MNAGIVGIGRLGRDLLASMCAHGFGVVAYDTANEAFDEIDASSSYERVESVREVSERATLIAVVVRTDADVLDVVCGPHGLADHVVPGTVVVIHSTVHVSTVHAVERALKPAGARVIDAPVCRPAGYDSGFIVLVGGDAAAVETARPLLDAIGEHVIHLGPLGAGMVTKSVRNATLYAAYAAVGDAMTVASYGGIEPDALSSVLRLSGVAGTAVDHFIELRAEWLGGGGEGPEARAGFADLAHKDIGVMIDIAAENRRDVPFTRAVQDAMRGAYAVDASAP